MRARRWTRAAGLLPVVTALGLTLSACGAGPGPGTAAIAGGESIATSRVDRLADAQCAVIAEQAGAGGQAVARSAVLQQSLGVLIEIALTGQFAAEQGAEASAQVRQFFRAQVLQGLPPSADEALVEFANELADAQADLAAVGAEAAGQQLDATTVGPLSQVGGQAYTVWRQDAVVETDPRYAPGPDGSPGAGDGSVSRPVSAVAAQGVVGPDGADPAYAASLPASQRCG